MIDVIKLSKMSQNELTLFMKNMDVEELEALLILVEKLVDRRSEIDNYLLEN